MVRKAADEVHAPSPGSCVWVQIGPPPHQRTSQCSAASARHCLHPVPPTSTNLGRPLRGCARVSNRIHFTGVGGVAWSTGPDIFFPASAMEDDGPLEVKVLPPPIPLTTADDPEAVETLLRTMGPEHALVGVRGQGAPLAARIGRGAVREGCAPRHPPFLAGRGTFATVHNMCSLFRWRGL
jgi:hypothetical protein